jgi:inhibitor of KinA sporulation pathway (predicted exonuclease)
VVDFEATCDCNTHDFPNEIIEFPCVALDTRTCRVVAEFHSFVRPLIRPKLTPFCTELTGITQQQVDAAPTLPEVIEQFKRWHAAQFGSKGSEEGAARTATRTVIATDGPWDMRDFMYKQAVLRDGVAFPPLFYKWVNLRKEYASFFKIKPLGVGQMLTRVGLTFEGRQHSGIDDARNIARIAASLIGRGCRLHHVSSIEVDGEDARLAAMVRAIEAP